MDICVVGCGQVSDIHFDAIKKHNIDFVDTDITKAIRQAKYYKRHASYDKIPDKQYDLGIVLTPNYTHAQVAQEFIDRNIPVFIEKPPALNQKDLEYLLDAEKNGAWICVGYNCRFLRSIRSIKEYLLSSNDEIIFLDCWKYRSLGTDYYQGWHGTWEKDGGVLCQQGSHCVDLAYYLAGAPMSVSMIGKNVKHNIECEDTCSVFLNYQNYIANVHCTTAMNQNSGNSGLQIVTKNGSILAGGFSFEYILEWKVPASEPKESKIKSIWHEVFNSLNNNDKSPLPMSEAIHSMRIIHAAYQANQERKAVNIGKFFPLLGV